MTVVLLDYSFFFSENTFEHHIWGSYNFKGVHLLSFSKLEAETELPSFHQVVVSAFIV